MKIKKRKKNGRKEYWERVMHQYFVRKLAATLDQLLLDKYRDCLIASVFPRPEVRSLFGQVLEWPIKIEKYNKGAIIPNA